MGAGNSASATLNPSSNTTYTFTATGANGCSDDATIAITVNNASPTATITNNSSSTEITCNLTSISVTGGGVGTGGSYLG